MFVKIILEFTFEDLWDISLVEKKLNTVVPAENDLLSLV